MTVAEQESSRPRALALDVDGVLRSGRRALPGAVGFLRQLEVSGMPWCVMTNCPFLDREVKAAELRSVGLPVPPSRLIGAADPLGEVLAGLQLRSATVYSQGVEPPGDYLRQFGLEVDVAAAAQELGAIILFDDDFGWTLPRIAEVYNLLRKCPELPLIVPNPDQVFPHEGELMPTSGSIARWLQGLCRLHDLHIDPIYLGKPYPPMYRRAEALLKGMDGSLKAGQIAMIGDSLFSDMAGAQRAGWLTGWMQTGMPAGKDVCAKPTRVFHHLDEVLEWVGLRA